MRRAGYATAADLAKATGLSNTVVGRYLNLRAAPIRQRDGDWTPAIVHIGETLNSMPSDLFPAQHLDRALKLSSAEVEMSFDDIALMPGSACDLIEYRTPETDAIDGDIRAAVTDALNLLTERQQDVIQSRYLADRADTLEQIAQRMGVTRERVRQIEHQALRKLQHPSSPIRRHIKSITMGGCK